MEKELLTTPPLSFLKQEFLASTQKMYNAELASVDFVQASEDARKTINEWVKGQTDGERGWRWPPTGSFLPSVCRSPFPRLSAWPWGPPSLPRAGQLSNRGISQSGNVNVLKMLKASSLWVPKLRLKVETNIECGIKGWKPRDPVSTSRCGHECFVPTPRLRNQAVSLVRVSVVGTEWSRHPQDTGSFAPTAAVTATCITSGAVCPQRTSPTSYTSVKSFPVGVRRPLGWFEEVIYILMTKNTLVKKFFISWKRIACLQMRPTDYHTSQKRRVFLFLAL